MKSKARAWKTTKTASYRKEMDWKSRKEPKNIPWMIFTNTWELEDTKF